MPIKSFEDMAASAHHAYCKQLQRSAQLAWVPELDTWAQLPPEEQSAWVEAVRQVAAEMAALH